jgi:steroid delta-isomerase
MSQVSDEHIANVMQQYVDAMSGDDVEAVVSLYADDAVVEDPVDSEPHRGIDALREFYRGPIQGVEKMELDGKVRARAPWGACAMKLTIAGGGGGMEVLDVMKFNDEGKIVSMVAYWGDSNFIPAS